MLTETQKARVRQVLGFPDYFRQRHTRLESVLNNLSPESEVQIAATFLLIDEVDVALLKYGTIRAGVKRVDEIWFSDRYRPLLEIRRLGRTYVGRISVILGVPPYGDYFSGQGYSGDNFSGPPAGNRGEGGWYNVG